MPVSIHHEGPLRRLALSGRLDVTAAPELRRELERLAWEPGVSGLLDLREVAYVSSAGLHELFALAKRLEAAGGRLAAYGANPEVRHILEISGFPTRVPLTETKEEARAALSA